MATSSCGGNSTGTNSMGVNWGSSEESSRRIPTNLFGQTSGGDDDRFFSAMHVVRSQCQFGASTIVIRFQSFPGLGKLARDSFVF